MVKKILLAAVLFVCGRVLADQGLVNAWGGTKFGMTKQEVAKVLEDPGIADTRALFAVHKNAAYANKVFTARLSFDPEDKKLVGVALLATVPKDKAGTAQYLEVVKYMNNKYGEAKPQKYSKYIDHTIWRFGKTIVDARLFHYPKMQNQTVAVTFLKQTTVNDTQYIKSKVLKNMSHGQIIVTRWNALRVVVVKRGASELESIRENREHTSSRVSDDSPYILSRVWKENYPMETDDKTKNLYRSKSDEYGVYVFLSPYTGCGLSLALEDNSGIRKQFPKIIQYHEYKWVEGFYDVCTKTLFDLSGKAYKNNRGDMILPIPVHRFLKDGTLEIGMPARLNNR